MSDYEDVDIDRTVIMSDMQSVQISEPDMGELECIDLVPTVAQAVRAATIFARVAVKQAGYEPDKYATMGVIYGYLLRVIYDHPEIEQERELA